MYILAFVLVIIAGLGNMVADYLLYSGKDAANPNQTKQEIALVTPEKDIVNSALLSLVSIMFWLVPSYFLTLVNTIFGKMAFFSLAMYVVSLVGFHIMVCYTVLVYKYKPEKETFLGKYIPYYAMISIITASIYTGSMIILGLKGVLVMRVWHYLSLPLFSVIIFQFILSKVLKKINHYDSVAGSISIIISLLSLIHIMWINQV